MGSGVDETRYCQYTAVYPIASVLHNKMAGNLNYGSH